LKVPDVSVLSLPKSNIATAAFVAGADVL